MHINFGFALRLRFLDVQFSDDIFILKVNLDPDPVLLGIYTTLGDMGQNVRTVVV